MTGVSNDGTGGASQAERSVRRRFESEVAMLQSDRLRLERHSNELDADIRIMEKSVNDRMLELEDRKVERARFIQRIQDIDAEILRKKRESYKKKI